MNLWILQLSSYEPWQLAQTASWYSLCQEIKAIEHKAAKSFNNMFKAMGDKQVRLRPMRWKQTQSDTSTCPKKTRSQRITAVCFFSGFLVSNLWLFRLLDFQKSTFFILTPKVALMWAIGCTFICSSQ